MNWKKALFAGSLGLAGSSIVFTLVLLGFVAFSAETNAGTGTAVGFFWERNATGANQWVDFLASRGFNATGYNAQDADSAPLDSLDMIIIATDAQTAWQDGANVEALRGSGKPVLAVGKGGSLYYNAAGYSIGWLNSGVDSHQRMAQIVNSSDPVLASPNVIDLPPNGIVEVHLANTSAVIPYLPLLSDNVSLFAMDPDAADAYAIICTEGSRYTLWGFMTKSPNELTETGQNLFENLVWHSLGGFPMSEMGSYLSIPSYLLALTGIVSARRGASHSPNTTFHN